MSKLKSLNGMAKTGIAGSGLIVGGSTLVGMGAVLYANRYHQRFMNTLLPQNAIASESGRYGYRTNPAANSPGLTGIKFNIGKSKVVL